MKQLDAVMCDVNKNYNARRGTDQLKPLNVNICAVGTFEKLWSALEKKSANPRVQLKMPRMVGDALHPELHEILKVNVVSGL